MFPNRAKRPLGSIAIFGSLLLAIICLGAWGQAPNGSGGVGASNPAWKPHLGMYVSPNEQYPSVALPIWGRSNHGAYVSVGTERSFMGAAAARSAALVIVDYDPEVIEFATVNRALLAASHAREDYITLRLSAPAETWAKRSGEVRNEDARTLRDVNRWVFWKQSVRENTDAWSGAFEHFHKRAASADAPFAQTNYMFDDTSYQHLRRLAREGRIWTRLVDLRDQQMVRKLCQGMHASGMKLGIVDTSNVPGEWDGGTAAAGRYLTWFSELAEADTLFLSTEPVRGRSDLWSYFAFTGRAVKGQMAETIAGWYEKEIAKLRSSPKPLALVDDPEVVPPLKKVSTPKAIQ